MILYFVFIVYNYKIINMGVPGFFRWIYQKHKESQLVIKDIQKLNGVESFFMDLNGLLHPQCFKVLDEHPHYKNLVELEKKMVQQCIQYIDEILDYVKPSKLVYLAVDGVAPMAKIKQQRYRRYKSVSDRYLFNRIKAKHNQPKTKSWNNSAITPGTIFLDKVKNAILDYCEMKMKQVNYKIIFSSGNTPGEGEHKLIHFIRTHGFKNYLIYGLDADLIFLSLATQKNNISLLREANQFNRKETGFNIIQIDTLKTLIFEIFNTIKSTIKDFPWKQLNKDKIWKDFILLYFFMGNDFIPHLPSTDIYHNGSDIIIRYYLETLQSKKQYLYKHDDTINSDFLLQIIKRISETETTDLLNIRDAKQKKIIPVYFRDYKREMYKIENMMFPFNDPVKLGVEKYEERYYKHYEVKDVKHLVHNYLKSISWISQYYLKGVPSWTFYYHYDIAPLATDLVKHYDHSLLNFSFELQQPLKPIEQLSLVLHPFSFYLLPPSIKHCLLKETKLFPKQFKLDYINKSKYFKVIPILPQFNVEKVKTLVGKKYLSSSEQNRNRLLKEYVFQK